MGAFGSGLWPQEYGAVKYLNSIDNSSVTGIAASDTTVTSTEGVDQLTYTVPAGHGGLYELTSVIVNGADSTSGGTHVVTAAVTYNDGTAQGLVDLGALDGGGAAGAPAGIDFSTANIKASACGRIYAAAGTDIVMALEHILNSTVPTAGTHTLLFSIERLA